MRVARAVCVFALFGGCASQVDVALDEQKEGDGSWLDAVDDSELFELAGTLVGREFVACQQECLPALQLSVDDGALSWVASPEGYDGEAHSFALPQIELTAAQLRTLRYDLMDGRGKPISSGTLSPLEFETGIMHGFEPYSGAYALRLAVRSVATRDVRVTAEQGAVGALTVRSFGESQDVVVPSGDSYEGALHIGDRIELRNGDTLVVGPFTTEVALSGLQAAWDLRVAAMMNLPATDELGDRIDDSVPVEPTVELIYTDHDTRNHAGVSDSSLSTVGAALRLSHVAMLHFRVFHGDTVLDRCEHAPSSDDLGSDPIEVVCERGTTLRLELAPAVY